MKKKIYVGKKNKKLYGKGLKKHPLNHTKIRRGGIRIG